MVSKPLRYRVAGWVRSHAGAVLLLGFVIALVAAAVLATASGARRTQTAPDRYQQAFGGDHDLVVRQESNAPVTDAVAGLPAVAKVEAVTFLFFGGVVADTGVEIDALPFAGSVAGLESRVIEGRQPDPGSIHEFVSTESTLEQTGMSIGDTAHFMSITPETGDEFGFNPGHLDGPQWDAELVGVIKSPSELQDGGAVIMFSEALLDGRIHNESTIMAVTLADGSTEPDLRAQLDTALPGEDFVIEPAASVTEDIRTAVRGQSIGLWLLAGFGALAAIAALGHLLARNVRLTPDEQRSLSALGYTPAQIAGEAAARAGAVVIGAMALAVAAAIVVSGLFPFGFARVIEPHPGLRVEAAVLALGAAVLGATIVGWVAIAAVPRRPTGATIRGGTVGALAAKSPWATLSTGLRFAFARRGWDSASLLASVAGTTLSVAALIGTLTFGISLDRLIDEPARYGENFDAMMDNGADQLTRDVLEIASANPNIADIELFRAGLARVGDTTLPMVTSEAYRGRIDPVMLDGRRPSAADEIALGAVSARKIGVGIGDTITVATQHASTELDVVGLVVPPGIRGFDLLGQGSYVPIEAFETLFPGSAPQTAGLRVAPGRNADEERARAAEQIGVPVEDTMLSPPSAITNLSRVTFVPYALSALLLGLGAIALAGALWTSVRRREQQIAVFRALGADRGWLRIAAAWQALAFTVVPSLIGAVIGLIAGRLVFTDFARAKGVVDDAATPWTLALGSLALLMLVALAATTLAGRRARNGLPAPLLRAG